MQNLQNILAGISEYHVRLTCTQGRYGERNFVFLTRLHPDDSSDNTGRLMTILLTGTEDDYYAIMTASKELAWLPIAHNVNLEVALQDLSRRVGEIKPEDHKEWWLAYEILVEALVEDDFVIQPHLSKMHTPKEALAILPPFIEDDPC